MTTRKPKGILFKGPMIKAILENRKTVTRRLGGLEELNAGYYRDRISKVECRDGVWCFWEVGHGSSAVPVFHAKPPYQPGDILYCKETFTPCSSYKPGTELTGVTFKDGGQQFKNGQYFPPLREYAAGAWDGIKWRPSIFMPRWAARIWLEVVSVRVERLNAITETEADAIAEGIPWCNFEHNLTDHCEKCRAVLYPSGVDGGSWVHCPPLEYRNLWNSISSPGSWDANPFVWRIEFKRVERPVE